MRISAVVLASLLIIGCGRKQVSFHNDVLPILDDRCAQCHGMVNPEANVVLTSYDSVMSARVTKWKKPIVVPGKPSESWIYLRSGTTQIHFRMPPDSSRIKPLSEKEVDLLGRWILEGAKNN